MLDYNYALSQVFSPSFIKKINDPIHEHDLRSLLHHCRLYPENVQWNFAKGLEITYDYLKRNYRCEYVYKNEIANQLLLNFHSDNSATLLSELKSDNSIADIVIINGRTCAYEIKTELDNLDRLPCQIESYRMLYDLVYIVSHPDLVSKLKRLTNNLAGIITMDKNGTLKKTKSSPINNSLFSPKKAALTLRQSELVKAYEFKIGKLPQMGTAQVHLFCYDWFSNLESTTARKLFLRALKDRKPLPHQFQLIKNCGSSLKIMFLGRDLPKNYCELVKNRLNLRP